jgi:hypothetical protein
VYSVGPEEEQKKKKKKKNSCYAEHCEIEVGLCM